VSQDLCTCTEKFTCPLHSHDPSTVPQPGYTVSFRLDISLRDYFAGQALQGLLAHQEWIGGSEVLEALGARALAIADAILEEKEKKP
jgi:hypothetical protein